MINYEKIYSQMSDKELLRLAERQSSLIEKAREALRAEVQQRGGVAAILTRVKEPQKILEKRSVDQEGVDGMHGEPPSLVWDWSQHWFE